MRPLVYTPFMTFEAIRKKASIAAANVADIILYSWYIKVPIVKSCQSVTVTCSFEVIRKHDSGDMDKYTNM